MSQDRIIMGIDPGTQVMGYGILEIKGNEVRMLSMGVIQLSKIEDHALRLKRIFDRTVALIDEHKPDELAIEAPFFGKNVQSMLKLGRAQGVAIAAALSRSMTVQEYSPKKIKQSITGNGNASKEQVAAMLKQILEFETSPKFLDATDAVAAALCHYYQRNSKNSGSKSYSGWGAFVKQNPGKLKSK
ncbi:MAG: crossover junction endodeoxyribonuclease RuvC [Flavobacteriales bacterium]